VRRKRNLLFVYGTLKRGFGNHDLLYRARFIGNAVTKHKYALYESGIPFVYPFEEVSQIKGEVYEVDRETLECIDALEGHPFWYRRQQVPVILESGREVTAWIYFYPERVGTLNVTGEYTGGFPEEEVEENLQWWF